MNNFHNFIKHETEIRYWTIGTCISLKFLLRISTCKIEESAKISLIKIIYNFISLFDGLIIQKKNRESARK